MSPSHRYRRLWLGTLALAGGVFAWLALAGALLWATLERAERARLLSVVEEVIAARGVLLALMVVVGLSACVQAVRAVLRHFVAPAGELAEQVQAAVDADVERELGARGSPEHRALAHAVNALVAQRSRLRLEMDARVQKASQRVEQERNRLSALMSELAQSVVVCNLDGRVLLYNERARAQFRALSRAPALADGAELIGLGRSIYAVFDRKLIAHALETIRLRLLRGDALPSSQFVTATAVGQLLRVQMAPVHAAVDRVDLADGLDLSGFVMVLDDVTREYEEARARDQGWYALTEGSRSALASMQAALDVLDTPDLDAGERARFLQVVREEARSWAHRVAMLDADAARRTHTRWPLEEMHGADLLNAALRRIEIATGLQATTLEIDGALWLRVESFSLLQALVYLAGRVADGFGVRYVELRLTAAPGGVGRAQLDLIWSGHAMSTETVMSWELDPMDATALTVRDVVERHGGAFWFERERARHQAFFRMLLPLADPRDRLPPPERAPEESRPEYYDFDLFKTSEQTRSLDDRLLTDLAYTVFDTETTGLDPSAGDEILQIGAARIVNGKLLARERFDQLVDPRRAIPVASIPIHGIDAARVAGQPTLDDVLPAFHAFARDTVLVAHNAAFDMRFLQLKERQTGVVFDQPVLDTLLLSAAVHPQQASHALEAIAERLGVPVVGRHTALGDALVAAQIFLKLVPLLAGQGILTLGQAREAAQKTYQSRLQY